MERQGPRVGRVEIDFASDGFGKLLRSHFFVEPPAKAQAASTFGHNDPIDVDEVIEPFLEPLIVETLVVEAATQGDNERHRHIVEEGFLKTRCLFDELSKETLRQWTHSWDRAVVHGDDPWFVGDGDSTQRDLLNHGLIVREGWGAESSQFCHTLPIQCEV